MSRWILCGILALGLAASGCLQSDTLVRVNPDGSGTLEVTTLIGGEMATMMQEMAAAFAEGFEDLESTDSGDSPETDPAEGDETAGDADMAMDLFPESDAREKAADYGVGVTFVSMEQIEEDGFIGTRTVYAFEDVTQLTLDMEPETPDAMGSGEMAGGSKPMQFGFQKLPNGNAELVVTLPLDDTKEDGDSEDTAYAEDGLDAGTPPEPSEADLAAMREMFQGLRFGIAVEPAGKLVKTNSLYSEGSRVTLFEIDFAALLEDPETLKTLAAQGEPGSMAEMQEMLKDIPGIKFNVEREVRIEFAGK